MASSTAAPASTLPPPVLDFYVTLTTIKQPELVSLLNTFQLTSDSTKTADMRQTLSQFFQSHPAPLYLYNHSALRHLVRVGSRGKWQPLLQHQQVRWHPYEFRGRSSTSALDSVPAPARPPPAGAQQTSEDSDVDIPPDLLSTNMVSAVRSLFDLDFDDPEMILTDEALLRAIEKDVEETWNRTNQGNPYKTVMELTQSKMRSCQIEQNQIQLHQDLQAVEKKTHVAQMLAVGSYRKTNAVNARVTGLSTRIDAADDRHQHQH